MRREFHAHKGGIRGIVYNKDGSMFVSCSGTSPGEHTVREWFDETLSCKHVFQGHSAEVVDVAYSPDEKNVVSCSVDGIVKEWSLKARGCIHTVKVPEWAWHVGYHPSGKFMAFT